MTDLKHLDKQTPHSLEMPLAKVGESAKVGRRSTAQDSKCHIALAVGVKTTRGEHADAVAIEQYRQQHLWMVTARTATVGVILIDRIEVELADDITQEQCEMSIW
jgi:hypothetical protein